MTLVVALFGGFVAVLGAVGVASPERLLARVADAQERLGLYFLAGLRIFLGMALVLAAPPSRAPLYLTALGALSLVSGAITPFFGTRRLQAMLGWWRARPAWAVRCWSAFVLVFGLSLVWAVLPVGRAL